MTSSVRVIRSERPARHPDMRRHDGSMARPDRFGPTPQAAVDTDLDHLDHLSSSRASDRTDRATRAGSRRTGAQAFEAPAAARSRPAARIPSIGRQKDAVVTVGGRGVQLDGRRMGRMPQAGAAGAAGSVSCRRRPPPVIRGNRAPQHLGGPASSGAGSAAGAAEGTSTGVSSAPRPAGRGDCLRYLQNAVVLAAPEKSDPVWPPHPPGPPPARPRRAAAGHKGPSIGRWRFSSPPGVGSAPSRTAWVSHASTSR